MIDAVAAERRAGPLLGIALLLPATLAVMASAALAPGLPQLFKAFGAVAGSRWLVPMVLTLPALCLIVFGPVAGYLGDRYGRRPLLIGGLLLYALLGLAPLVLDDLYAILVSRVGVGIAEAFALTLSTAMIGDYFAGAERDKWLGYQVAVASVSAIVYIAVAGALGSYGWRGPFLIYVTPLLFAALIVLVTSRTRQTMPDTGGPRTMFPWAAMVPIWPISLVAAILFYAAQLQSGVALHAKGVVDPGRIGMLLALATLATVAGSLAFRFLVAWPTSRLLLIGFGCLGIGFVGISRAPDPTTLTIALAVAQFGCGMVLPTTMTWAIRQLPPSVRGRGIGMWHGVFSFGQFLSPLAVTAITASTGGLFATFGVLGVAGLAAAALAPLTLMAFARRVGTPRIERPATT